MVDVVTVDDTQILSQEVVDAILLEEVSVVSVVTQAEQGPPGPPGPSGGSALSRTAGQTLSALIAVWEDEAGTVRPLDSADGAHIDLLLGVTLTAAAAGQPINVQRSGALTDAAWAWTPGRVYLGANGALTQTPPSGGFDVLIGPAVSATRILLNFQDPIELE